MDNATPAISAINERVRNLKRWKDSKAEPPRMSAETRMQREFLGDLVGSPAWDRIVVLANEYVAPYAVPLPRKEEEEKAYEVFNFVRDIVAGLLQSIAADATLSSVNKEEE